MSKMVKVWNTNTHDHQEKFKGTMITIKAGGYVEMTADEAVEFKGQFYPPVVKNGVHFPEGFKKLRLEPIETVGGATVEEPDEHICIACGFKAASKAGLASHVRANHANQMIDDDAREALVGSA